MQAAIKTNEEARCNDCLLYRPPYPYAKGKECTINTKEYSGPIDGIRCALVRETHTLQVSNPEDLVKLRTPCKDVDIISDKELVEEIIAKLRETLDWNGRKAIGISANQIGYDRNITIMRYPNAATEDQEIIMINPVLEECKDIHWVWESCLSIDHGFTPSPAPRGTEILVRWMDENYATMQAGFSIIHDKDLAIAVQHEIDHLNGILILDYRIKSSLTSEAQGRLEAANAASERAIIAQHTPYVRKGKKLRRNSPCNCGSGKKYKKCCGSQIAA